MKKIYLSIILATIISITGFAQLLLEENFDYGGTTGSLVTLSGGSWANHSGTAGTLMYQTTSLSMSDYASSGVGGSAIVDGTQFEDANISVTPVTSGTIYASALINIASASTTENYFMHFQTGSTSFFGRVYGKDDGSGNLNLGVRETSAGLPVYSSVNYSYNTTYIVVLKYDFTSGTASLFVLNAVSTTEPAADAASLDGTDASTIDKFSLRQSTNIPLVSVDGLRVGITWDDLFPIVATPDQLTVTSSSTPTSCIGMADGSASITVTGGTTAYTYLWDSGSTTDTQTGLSAGAQSFMVTISDATTITEVHTVNVTISEPTAITISSTITDPICTASNGDINVEATGGSGVYNTYTWSTVQGTLTSATGLSAATYSVTITDDAGCSNDAAFVLNSASNPTPITITNANTSPACGASDGEISITVTGGSGVYTDYTWSTAQGTLTSATGLAIGTYSITITDDNGCTQGASIVLNASNGPSVTITSNNISCNGASDGDVTATVSGGTTPYTFNWAGTGTGSPTNNSNSSTVSGIGAGNFAVTVTAAGCEGYGSTVVTEPNALSVTLTANDITCNGLSDGSGVVTVAGGTTPYVYIWEGNSSTTNTASGYSAGSYGVTISDNANCTAFTTLTINEPTALTVTVAATDVTCNGLSDGSLLAVVSGGSTPYNYTWAGNASTTNSATGYSMGSFLLTVSDNSLCAVTVSTDVAEPTALTASMVGTDETTGNDGTLTATVSGGTAPYNYAWTTSNTTSSASATGIAAGTYIATITDTNGCKATTNSVTVAANANITPIYDIQFVTSNVPGTSDASPMLDDNVTIKGIVTALISKGSTVGYWVQDDESLWSGIYVQDNTNNPMRGDEIMITGLVAEYYTSTQLKTITAYSVLSSGNPLNPISISTLDSKTEAVEGVLVKVSNANCDTVASGATYGVWTVNDGSGPAQIENDIFSYGAEILDENYDVTGVGYYTFGNMFVAPRDINDVNVSCNYSITSVVTNSSCNGSDDGSIAVTTSGTAVTFSYAWSHDVVTTANVSNLAAGNYEVTVSGDGCLIKSSYVITEPDAINIASTTTNTACATAVGSINATATGGSGVYSSYTWSNGGTTANITGLSNAAYTLTVTDSNNCTGKATIGVNSTDGPNITVTETQISCNLENDGQVLADVSGGLTPYTYTWSGTGTGSPTNTSNSSSVSMLAEGTFDITVNDASNCKGFASTLIVNPELITISLNVTQESASDASDGSATATGLGGSGTITFNWSNGTSGATASNLTEGSYSVTATDANGCTASLDFDISSSIPIYDIQYSTTGPDYISPLVNQSVKVKGVITALLNKGTSVGYWIQDAESLWSGIYVQDNVNTPSRGDKVSLTAVVTEYYNSTQLKTVSNYTLISSGNTLLPVEISTADASSEMVEGVLVKIIAASCTEVASGANFGVWSADDGSGVAKIENDIYSYGSEVLGTKYCVTGVGYYTFGNMFIAPRDAADVQSNCISGIDEFTKNDIVLYPNPANDILTISSDANIDIVRVIDLRGTIVYQSNNSQNGEIVTLDLSHVAEGLYNVQVISGTSISNSKVIVK